MSRRVERILSQADEWKRRIKVFFFIFFLKKKGNKERGKMILFIQYNMSMMMKMCAHTHTLLLSCKSLSS